MFNNLASLQLEQKRVFVRVDFNVPLSDDGKILDDSRIQAALPTLKYILQKHGRLIVASHLGRPEGRPEPRFSLMPIAAALAELLQCEVCLTESPADDSNAALLHDLKEGQILMLENLRFDPGEEANDPIFAEKLASLADIYVNDAFGTMHRAHASTVGMVPRVGQKAAGFLVEKEVKFLKPLLENAPRPFTAIMGGAKISDKIGVLENLIKKVDALLIGGAMAYTFLKARGVEIGASRVEENKLRQAERILEKARLRDVRVLLPVDHVIAEQFRSHAPTQVTPTAVIPAGWMGLDIGPRTIHEFKTWIQRSETIFWNGPVGAFETPPFDQGSCEIARLMSESSAITVVGGGESVAVVRQAKLDHKISHLSTGGGATLEFLEGRILPGLQALEEKPAK